MPLPLASCAYVLLIIALITLYGNRLFFGLLFLFDYGLLKDSAWERERGRSTLVGFPSLPPFLLMAESASYLPNIHFPTFLSNRPHSLGLPNASTKTPTKQDNTQNCAFQLPLQIGQASEIQVEEACIGRGFWENSLKDVNTAGGMCPLAFFPLLPSCCLRLSCNGCSTSSPCVSMRKPCRWKQTLRIVD